MFVLFGIFPKFLMFGLFGLFARNELLRLVRLMDPAYRYHFRADSVWENSANLTSRRFFSKIGQIEKIKKIENEECLVWLELSNDNDFEKITKNYQNLAFLSVSMIFYQNLSIFTRQNIYFFCHIEAEKFWTNFWKIRISLTDVSERLIERRDSQLLPVKGGTSG